MNPVASVASVLRNLLNFRGRISRSEYWWFFLLALVVGLAALGRFAGIWSWPLSILDPYFLMLSLAFLLPVIYLAVMPAATMRRLHDTGHSALWLLLCGVIVLGWASILGLAYLTVKFANDDGFTAIFFWFILGGIWILVSLVGMTVLTIMLALPGTVGPNRYGADPLRPELRDGLILPSAHTYASLEEEPASLLAGDQSSSTEPWSASQRFCSQCGLQLQPEGRFCVSCGAAV